MSALTTLNLNLSAVDTSEGPVILIAAGSQKDERAAPPHQHARGQLLGSMRGLLSVGVEQAMWIVPAVHAVWLPPHCVHSIRSHGPFDGWSAYISESTCADLPAAPCTIRTSGLLREAILRACEWPEGPLDEAAGHLAAVIIDEIRTLPVEPFGLPMPQDVRLQRIARALVSDPADDRGLEHGASWAAIGSRTLSRRFVAETGFTFTAWRQRARLMRSLEMLAADVPVTTIALDLGYATASSFISVFKRTLGATPAAYRQRLSGGSLGGTI